ncbi:hypothetical protein THITH_09805 [Thioalkalivibrio paradoxus ARh 1]|uniref:Uncharacterized protein n=1 Tax=Thioalkalivibrio paradoxus ARh 1 TaxID=713585 RepID=W0DT06_9GAMM|nr:hypothetical protein THITH_09805 [Thioalkalivibrio paradoxus ARh 1]
MGFGAHLKYADKRLLQFAFVLSRNVVKKVEHRIEGVEDSGDSPCGTFAYNIKNSKQVRCDTSLSFYLWFLVVFEIIKDAMKQMKIGLERLVGIGRLKGSNEFSFKTDRVDVSAKPVEIICHYQGFDH